MYSLNIATAIKSCLSMKSETLSLKTIINWIFYRKQLLFNETLEKKRFIVACK